MTYRREAHKRRDLDQLALGNINYCSGTASTFQPLGTDVLYRLIPKDRETESGLYVVGRHFDNEVQYGATVFAVGPRVLGVVAGDKVVCKHDVMSRSMLKFPDDDNLYELVPEDMVLGVIDG